MSKVVNVKTQEEWDFVTTKMNLIWYVPFEKLSHPKGQVCIHIESSGHSYVDWAKKNGYKVISFDEWCKENGYKQPVDLIGRYVKALEDAPYAGSVKEGEYALIVRENASEYVVDFPSHKSYFIRKTCIPSSRIELMPVGFEPEAEVKEEWIPKVEDWVTMIKDYGQLKKGTTAKIKENQRDNCWWLDLSWGAAPFSSMFRKATQAEINAVNKPVESKTEDLLSEAKRRYPVGSKFYPAHIDKAANYTCIITEEDIDKIHFEEKDIYISYGNIIKNGHSISEVLYAKGKWAEIVEKTEEAQLKANIKEVERRREEKWQVGGYVRLLREYKHKKKGDILKIKEYSKNDYGGTDVIECEDSILLYIGLECEWLGMQKPVEYPVWNSYQKDDFHYITGIDSYCKTSDECYQKYEVIKTTEPIILKKQQKINYLNV